jgi:hypothetical protein
VKWNCTDERKNDKDNVIAMAQEIFSPLRDRGLTVMLNIILYAGTFNFLGVNYSPTFKP